MSKPAGHISRPTRRRNRVVLALVTLVIIAVAPLTAFLICDSYERANQENTLHRNGNWYNTKLLLEKRLAGTGAFMVTGKALSKDRLDLGAWCGFQEVVYQEPLAVAQIQFDAALPDERSYLVFYFSHTASGSAGIRISRSPKFPSLFFEADSLGAFQTRQALDIASPDDRWHKYTVTFDKQRQNAGIAIDGEEVCELAYAPPEKQSVGFRNGHFSVLIDNVHIATLSSSAAFQDSFELSRTFPVHIPIVAVLLGLDMLVFLLAAWKTKSFVQGSFALILANLVLLFSAFFFQQGLYHILSTRYATRNEGTIARLEILGYDDNVPEGQFGVDEINARYDPQSLRPVRILFMGGSQTWGAGAATEAQTFVAQIGARLVEAGHACDCINAGINGATSSDQRTLYEREWMKFQPDLAVLNFGTNDKSVEELAKNVRYLLGINHRLGIQSIVVLEPIAIEQPASDPCTGSQDGVLQGMKHDSVRQVAGEFAVPVVDMLSHLAQPDLYDSGFLWADDMHLSPYGHQLFADRLYPEVEKALGGVQ